MQETSGTMLVTGIPSCDRSREEKMRLICVALGTFVGVAGLFAHVQTLSSAELTFEYVKSIGSQGSDPGHFKYIEDFAFAQNGDLLVTDAAHAWVQVFDKRTGEFVTRFGGKGEDDQNLDKPEGIAVDSDGNVFVADYNSGYVKKYSPSYQHLQTFSEYGSGPGQNMKSEFMTIRGDRLYLPDAGNDRINVFNLSGGFLFHFGAPGLLPGLLNTPEAVRFGPDGNLYVTDLRNNRVQVFAADGQFIRTWGKTGKEPGQLRSPSGLAFDRYGRLYVAEIGNDRIQVFDITGRLLGAVGQPGSGPGEFSNLHGLAVDPDDERLFVADTGNHRIQVFKMLPPAVHQ